MDSPTNEYDPRHPHERIEPPIQPVLDIEGRCLVCLYSHAMSELRDPVVDEPRPARAVHP